MIWFSSDPHFFHDKEFCYKPRGFDSEKEMTENILKLYNYFVKPEDDFYILGDIFLGKTEDCKNIVEKINGKIHIILGNHDSPKKIDYYKNCINVVEVTYATMIRYKKYDFYLSHYPTLIRGDYNIKDKRYNLCGHWHTDDKFCQMHDFIYHVEVDAHDNMPVSLEQIIDDIKEYNKKND